MLEKNGIIYTHKEGKIPVSIADRCEGMVN
jgi:hypothetical protein